MSEVGDRVRIALDVPGTEIKGGAWGTYQGEEQYTGEGFDGKSPRIDLDDGPTVWGHQVWWVPASGYAEIEKKAREAALEVTDHLYTWIVKVLRAKRIHRLGRQRARILRWERRRIPLNFVQREAADRLNRCATCPLQAICKVLAVSDFAQLFAPDGKE